eukprot:356245-Chlamydomonas_euryale.AAC.5
MQAYVLAYIWEVTSVHTSRPAPSWARLRGLPQQTCVLPSHATALPGRRAGESLRRSTGINQQLAIGGGLTILLRYGRDAAVCLGCGGAPEVVAVRPHFQDTPTLRTPTCPADVRPRADPTQGPYKLQVSSQVLLGGNTCNLTRSGAGTQTCACS